MTEMDQDRKYLRITIYDNDFMDELENAAWILWQSFGCYEKAPTEKDFPYLEKCIRNIMSSSYCVNILCRGDENLPDTDTCYEYFIPKLSIVKREDIPDWENYECIYVPLFPGGDEEDILKR